MLPKSIARFQVLFIAGTAISILSILLYYSAWRDFAVSRGGAAASPLIGILFAAVIGWAFWFFIVRRSSAIAKWLLCISIVFTVTGLPTSLARATVIGNSYLALFVVATTLQILAPFLLFRRDAREWFKYKGRVPEPVSDVFS